MIQVQAVTLLFLPLLTENIMIQTMKKTIALQPNWKDNNYEGYADYISKTVAVQKVLTDLFMSNDLEVISLTVDLAVTVKQVEQESTERLDSSFWVDLATGKI